MIGKTYKSRLKNSKRNILSGLLKQLVAIVLTFLIRTVILYSLGAEYQGLSGLFTSILQVLNLTELGFSAAVTFILYKPIAENDTDTICAVMAFLKKVYRIIGIVILIAGTVIMPFLTLLIKGDYPKEINIYVLYAIYLTNAVSSYLLFAYKNTLLTAMQRIDLVSNAYTVTNLLGKMLQIVVLIMFKNYYVYVLILPVTSIANNIVVEVMSRKVYPNVMAKGILSNDIKTSLSKQVKAVFINRIGDVARNSFDNIVLSAYVGLVAVAVYDNYYYIYTALYGIMGIIVQSLRASIGNSLVTESVEKNYNDLLKFSFIFMWIVGWMTTCLFVLYQPFMYLWMKGNEELILSFKDMSLFCLYFYSICMAYTKNAYLEAQGLFYESRFLYILEAVGNLVFNIILCKFMGVTGILIATILTIFLFNFSGGTVVLFEHYFMRSAKEFSIHHLFYFLITTVACVGTFAVCRLLPTKGILDFVLRMIICVFIPNIIYIIAYCKMPQFSSVRGFAKKFLSR